MLQGRWKGQRMGNQGRNPAEAGYLMFDRLFGTSYVPRCLKRRRSFAILALFNTENELNSLNFSNYLAL